MSDQDPVGPPRELATGRGRGPVRGLRTGARHRFRVLPPRLHVRLPIDPRDSHTWDERFILSIDRHGCVETVVQTVRDDQIPGDDCVDLVFDRLEPGARYSLHVDPGAEGEPYLVFADLLHDEIFPE